MRILVTGGAGRIGVIVCKAALQNGFEVRIFDLENSTTRRNVGDLGKKAEIIWGDITEPDSVRKALKDVKAVVHMAAVLTAVIDSKPELATRINVGGTQTLVDLIKENNNPIPFVYASSVAVFGPTPDATQPLSPEKDFPKPKGPYAETKFQAENLIKASGMDYVILRLGSHWQSQIFSRSEFRYMFRIPLSTRIEIVHPDDTVLAILNAIKHFNTVKGNTLVISGGPNCRMVHRDRVNAILKVLGLPFPSESKFSEVPAPMDWYDTRNSQELLHFQERTFADCIEDYRRELDRRYSPLFLPLMRYFVGPVFGKLIVSGFI